MENVCRRFPSQAIYGTAVSCHRHFAHEVEGHKLYFFYSNHRPEDAPFLDVLKKIETTNPNFRFIGTMTDMSRSKKVWDGETGYIKKALLSKYLGNLQGPVDGCRYEGDARESQRRRGRHPSGRICWILMKYESTLDVLL